jgi:hypothetical protein
MDIGVFNYLFLILSHGDSCSVKNVSCSQASAWEQAQFLFRHYLDIVKFPPLPFGNE